MGNTKGMIIIFAMTVLLCQGCQGKGNVTGDVTIELSPLLKDMGMSEKVDHPKNQNIYLIKYDENLLTKHEQLRLKCLNKQKAIVKSASPGINEALNQQNVKLANFLVTEMLTESMSITNECNMQRHNLYFDKILMTAKTDDNGHYDFKEVPYGKYYISFAYGDKWWLIPVMIESDNKQLDLTNQNASAIYD